VKDRNESGAAPGAAIPYVGARGEMFHREGSSLPRPGCSGTPAAPLGQIIRVCKGAGCLNNLENFAWVKEESKIAHADVIVVDSVDCSRLESLEALAARLCGKRLADNLWLRSGRKKGLCYAFEAACYRKMFLYVSQAFVAERPKYAKLLTDVSSMAEKKAKGDRHLHVHVGSMPDKPKHPRLTFQVVSDAEHKVGDVPKHCLNLAELFHKCTFLHSACRAT
jgi:hypothetical protein